MNGKDDVIINEEEYNSINIVKVISFNLRRDVPFFSSNKWIDRQDVAVNIIKASKAAIIGVQELLPSMRDSLKKKLPGYAFFGDGRYYGEKPNQDEHSDIIIDTNKVEIISYKTFWLSKNPERKKSRSSFAMFPRICTVAELKLKSNGRRVRVFNTHFDHISWLARNLGVRLILKYMDKFNATDPLATILMGDMNAKPKTHAIRILRENLHMYKGVHLIDCYTHIASNTLGNTLHNFSGKVMLGKSPIDYIFVSDHFYIKEVFTITEEENGQYPSDHFPVCAILELKDNKVSAKL